ncbi:MAG: ABC transporter ATP-binding protein [Methyloligellaceae bacterium]
MTLLVRTEDLHKRFGPNKAVDGISLTVAKGEVLGFLGPNGAGKSTTMKMITGFLEPDAGRVSVCGIDVWEKPLQAKARIGYLPEGAPLYGDMTTGDFLDFIAAIRGFDGKEREKRIDAAVEDTKLAPVMDQTIETLSKGYKRRVGLAQAILHDPDVLILDEPTDGLDPNQKHHVRELIRTMAEKKAIIISTHILEEVEAACTRAVVIDRGRVVADGTAEELQRQVPYHNAILISVAADAAQRLQQDLGKIGTVAKVEPVGKANGSVRLRAYPANGQAIAADVAELIKKRRIPVQEMIVERGRLDDVFRRITTPDTGGRDA